MWRSTAPWFADCANPRLLRRPNWTPLMVSRRWSGWLSQQSGAGGAVRSKPETTTSQLNPNSTAKSRFEIFSKSIRDLAGFRSVVVVTGSARISLPPHPHAIRDHRSAPVSSWFDPIRISPELWVSIPAESHSIHAGQVTTTASTDLKTG